jgi:hypothetical protein
MAKQIIIKGTPVVAANEVLVADSNSKIPAVDGSLVTTMAGGNITGTIPTARLDSGTTANKVVVVGASGLPAVDGSLLTGIVSYTKSASDPTISTNPSGGVGTEWVNHTTGKQFICTDATAGENVWTCSGGGTGDIQPFNFPGSSYGYVFGGQGPTTAAIDRVSFASDGNATNVGNILVAGGERTGCSSPTHGYCAGGYPPGGNSNVIERMSFSAEGNTADVGDLTSTRRDLGSCSSETHCYWMGQGNIIERSADASSSNAVDVGDATVAYSHAAGSSDPGAGYGYIHGGYVSGAQSVYIERFQMQASANGVDVGDLAVGTGQTGGTSSLTHGYNIGAGSAPSRTDHIQKFAFASSASGSDIGNLLAAIWVSAGISSLTYSYSCGGDTGGGGTPSNVVQKWPHASDTNSTDVGDLTATKNYLGPVGAQY